MTLSPWTFVRALAMGGVALALACSAPAAPSPAATGGAGPTAASGGSTPAAAVSAAASGQGDTLQALVQGAKSEGELDLSWSQDTAGGSQGAQDWINGFNKLYGLQVKVQFTPGPSMPDMAAKITQENQAHKPASSDVSIGSEAHVADLMKAGTLIPENWAAWAPNVKDPRLLAPNGVAVEIATRDPGISYNTNALKGEAVPRTLQDLLKPEYKGKIASTPYAATFDRAGSPQLWGPAKTLDYVRQLASQIGGLLRCGDDAQILSGKFEAMALDCGGYDALTWQKKGAPLGHVIPSDLATLAYWYMGVPKNAAHPNTAKLFINYVMSREGQDVLWKDDSIDQNLVPGSHTAQQIDALQKQGVKFTSVDVQFVERDDPQKVGALRKQLQDILQHKAS